MQQAEAQTVEGYNFYAGQIPCTAGARTRARNSPRELCGGRSGTRAGFPQATGVHIVTGMAI